MPRYQVQHPDGRKITIEGDSPPTDEDLDSIFSSIPVKEPISSYPYSSQKKALLAGTIFGYPGAVAGATGGEMLRQGARALRGKGFFLPFTMGGGVGYGSQPGSENILPTAGQMAGTIFGYPGAVAGATGGEMLRQGARALRGKGFFLPEIGKTAAITAGTEGLMRFIPNVFFRKQIGGEARKFVGKELGELVSKVSQANPELIETQPFINRIQRYLNKFPFEHGPAKTALEKHIGELSGKTIPEYSFLERGQFEIPKGSSSTITRPEKFTYEPLIKRNQFEIPQSFPPTKKYAVLPQTYVKSSLGAMGPSIMEPKIVSHKPVLSFGKARQFEQQLGREAQFASEATSGPFKKAPKAPMLNEALKRVRSKVSRVVDLAAEEAGYPEFATKSKEYSELLRKFPEKELRKGTSLTPFLLKSLALGGGLGSALLHHPAVGIPMGVMSTLSMIPQNVRTALFRNFLNRPIGQALSTASRMGTSEGIRRLLNQ